MYQIKEWTAWSDVINELRLLGLSRIASERLMRSSIADGELLRHDPLGDGDSYVVKTDLVKRQELYPQEITSDTGFDINVDEDFIKKIESLIDGTYIDQDKSVSLFDL
jgi:hypothetical protein